ncbi:YopX family protein [Enterococcus sp. LJL51]|uniref:YopX family protein n=1 Tax=Enterococcus sp. LJL51 TaxID=3416656 RepID=UPI003CED8027
MREIKFRAWDKEAEQMVLQMENGNEYVWMIGTEDIFIQHITENNIPEQVLMQYTGLKDKNGVEIYEGDLIKFKFNQMSGRGFVYWNKEIGQWWIKDIREVTKKRGQRYYPFWKKCPYIVCGNIYENPELLEEAKHE